MKLINLLNSLFGFFLAVILIIIAAILLGYKSIKVQEREATNYYSVDYNSLKSHDVNNKNAYTLKDGK